MTYSIKEQFTRGRKMKALVVSMLALTVLAASLLAPAPAQAAFPGTNGKIVFSSSRTTGTGVNNPEGDLEIFTMNPDGTGLKQLTTNKETDAAPAYSSDGEEIVFHSARTGNFEVFVMNADGTGQTNLTKNPASDLRPTFSPVGNKIIFDSARNSIDNPDVFIMGADGTGQTALTSDPRRDTNATFSPDGSKIAFVSDRGIGDSEIFVMNFDGTGQTPLTNNSATDDNPTFSPDGQKIAFASNRDGQGDFEDFDVFVMNAKDGSGTIRLTGSRAKDDQPSFSPDGREVVFVSTRDGGDSDVFVMTASGATQVDLTPNTNIDTSPDWQPTAAPFTVDQTVDTPDVDVGDGDCDVTLAVTGSQCTLRAAIQEANATPEADLIRFAIPGTGVKTIDVGFLGFEELPTIIHPVTIDGYTQPGASPNTKAVGNNAVLKIELNGSEAGLNKDGLRLGSGSSSVVKGLVINRFGGGFGINMDVADRNRVEGNFIGTDPSGTQDLGNAVGVNIPANSSSNTVGGSSPAARNLISGNDGNGVAVRGNGFNKVLGNYIGTDKDGVRDLGNTFSGVDILGSSNNTVGDGTSGGANVIAFNDVGVTINSFGGVNADRNPVLSNSIFSNDNNFGIDLGGDGGTTANDGDDPNTPQVDPDADTGPNSLQNFPVLSSAKKISSAKTVVKGKLNSTPSTFFKVQFFSNPPGGSEGKKLIGQKRVTTDAGGKASFVKVLPKVAVGRTITATATGAVGNTSELSAPRKVAAS